MQDVERAVREGFAAVLVTDATRAISPETAAAAHDSFRALGVTETEAATLLV